MAKVKGRRKCEKWKVDETEKRKIKALNTERRCLDFITLIFFKSKNTLRPGMRQLSFRI